MIVFIFGLINQVELSVYGFLFPLLLIELYVFSLGCALILATIYVKFRDIGPIWEVLLQVGMYMTPIIYPLSLIIEKADVNIAKVLLMNPMAQIIQDMRYLFTSPENLTVSQLIDSKLIMLIPYVIPFIVLIVGFLIFNKNSKKFAEII